MDSELSTPQVSLPQVSTDSNQNSPVVETGSMQPQPIAAGSVMYANQPLLVETEARPADMPTISVPNIADDVDLIEKDWINKIKDTIHITKGDPYERARQLALLKSEYLQKRYQKTIKIT